MRKRLLASIMAMVLLPSLFPVSALAVERDKGSETPVACAVTEGCTLQAGHKCECVLPDEPETTEDDPAPADNVMSGNCGLYDYINKEYTDTVKWALTANDEDGYTLTIFGNGPMGNAYITEDNVSSGEPEWHYSREKITRVVIQDGVTSVGAKSFKNYTNLKTVVLPASITKIGQDSFYGSGITSITLPANLTTIEPQAFYKCSSLNGTISVPVGVFSIPSYTFAATSISSIEDDQLKANKVGKTTITATARTEAGGTGTLTVNVEVTPMRIIYGKAATTQNDDGIGRPYITYALNEDGTAPKFSDLLGFYPVKEGSQNGTYEADITKDKIDLKPGIGDDSDVYYVYQNDVSGNIIQTDTLPTHPTTDADGNPHSIRVELKLKNPNYRFCTVGTNWQPSDTIILYVTCYEEGMNEVDLYLEGDDKPLETFEGDRVYEYTGQGIVPTTRNLTTLYTKGTSTDHSITSFTAHFHAVQEGTAFSGTHLYNQTNSHLTADALKAIAPTELGVYSFVINGYSKDTKTYCYASRRYSIVMGNPKGEPTFDKVSSGVELSTITLSGSMKNAAGIEVAGTFSWDDGDQTLERGKSYA